MTRMEEQMCLGNCGRGVCEPVALGRGGFREKFQGGANQCFKK